MPRRQQQLYNNKKKRRLRGGSRSNTRDDSFNNNNNNNNTTSLEEDLRQQRQRQQQRDKERAEQANAAGAAEKNPLEQQEGICPIFIAGTLPRPQQQLLWKGVTSSYMTNEASSQLSPSYSKPSFGLGYLQEASPFLTTHGRAQRLRCLWHSKYLLENICVHSRASALYSKKLKWLDHTLPDGLHCSWDLTCKHRLHPSARTIDVAMIDELDQLPTIATIVQGGWGLFRVPPVSAVAGGSSSRSENENGNGNGSGRMSHQLYEQHVHTMRCPPVHSIRMHEGSGRCGAVVRSPHGSYRFQWYPLPHSSTYVEADLQLPVTDFCFGKDLVLFSCPRYHSNNAISPLFLPLDGGGAGCLRSLNVRNFPQSDAMRVEMACDDLDKFVAFGHRNGQVSLLDLRASDTVCSILQCEEPYDATASSSSCMPLGSVTDLAFVSSSFSDSKQMIVKRSFGSCQLHDLRRNSSSINQSSTTVLQNMVVPHEHINPTLSANCNGFAIDPSGKQTLFAPYINENHDACLGVWSLGTGKMVGSRRLQSNSAEHTVMYVEVCQRTTPSFSSGKNGNVGKASSSSFGVWLKCGAFTKGRISSKVGSLHQISFPGR
jgi:hypothetical protein